MAGRDADLEKYFLANVECEALGAVFVCDPNRARVTFPEHRADRLPQVFIEAIQEKNSVLSAGVMPGDAIWLLGGDPARYRKVHVDSVASLIATVAEMHNPYAGTSVNYVCGSDRPGKESIGWGLCRNLRIPDTSLPEVQELAARLTAHAHSTGRTIQRGIRVDDGIGDDPPRPTPIDANEMVSTMDLPVHEQFYLVLIMELIARTPCTARVTLSHRSIDARLIEGQDEPDRPLHRVMAQYQVGSATNFIAHAQAHAAQAYTFNLMNFAWQVEQAGTVLRVHVTRPEDA